MKILKAFNNIFASNTQNLIKTNESCPIYCIIKAAYLRTKNILVLDEENLQKQKRR